MIEEPKPPRLEGEEIVIETQNALESYDAKYLVSALLVYVAKGNGNISGEEVTEMLTMVGDHFDLQSPQSLELITNVMEDIAENPDIENLLKDLSPLLAAEEIEDVTVMMLKIVAADGRRDVDELETFQTAAQIIGVSAETLHRAYDRYFEETRA